MLSFNAAWILYSLFFLFYLDKVSVLLKRKHKKESIQGHIIENTILYTLPQINSGFTSHHPSWFWDCLQLIAIITLYYNFIYLYIDIYIYLHALLLISNEPLHEGYAYLYIPAPHVYTIQCLTHNQ